MPQPQNRFQQRFRMNDVRIFPPYSVAAKKRAELTKQK
jgi:hypothetical protein